MTNPRIVIGCLLALTIGAMACNAPAGGSATSLPTNPPISDATQPPTAEATTESAATPTYAAPATEPPTAEGDLVSQPIDVTAQGTVEASTVYTGYPAAQAVDGDPTTSWFSTGPDPFGAPTTFTWTGKENYLISTIIMLSNEKHPEFPTDYGFGSVIIQIFDASGAEVFTETVELPGTPDPNVRITPNVEGRTVLLTLEDTEAPDCGGFAELSIIGLAAE